MDVYKIKRDTNFGLTKVDLNRGVVLFSSGLNSEILLYIETAFNYYISTM